MTKTSHRPRGLGLALRLGAIALLAALSAAPAARASDGALEIHRACVATGCFPGDSPGFPVEITQSGSYLLTSDLRVPDENTTAILSSGERVSIDLGGFSISGVTECGGVPLVCSPTGTGIGIEFEFATVGSAANGVIEGMGSSGILRGGGLFENLILRSNGGAGISTNGTVRNCQALRNGSTGIACGGLALDNFVAGNGLTGISCLAASVIRGNRVLENGSAGDSPGVNAAGGFVTGNLIVANRGIGLSGTSDLAYGDNVLYDNNDAAGGPTADNQVVAQGVQLGPNLCQGVPCP